MVRTEKKVERWIHSLIQANLLQHNICDEMEVCAIR